MDWLTLGRRLPQFPMSNPNEFLTAVDTAGWFVEGVGRGEPGDERVPTLRRGKSRVGVGGSSTFVAGKRRAEDGRRYSRVARTGATTPDNLSSTLALQSHHLCLRPRPPLRSALVSTIMERQL